MKPIKSCLNFIVKAMLKHIEYKVDKFYQMYKFKELTKINHHRVY